MEKTIIITILAEDILKNSYFDSKRCPITRALHRAGYKTLYDDGTLSGTLDGKSVYVTNTNESYQKLLTKLFGMYNTKANGNRTYGSGEPAGVIPIEDFTVTLNFQV